MKIVFFGSRHVHSVIWSLNNNFDLKLLVTTDNATTSYASSEKIPYTQVLAIDDKLIKEVNKLEPDLGIVADFGLIIPKKLIELFPLGILNIHPSLLPKYRGSTPVQTAILNGDKKTGISIIKIDDKLDHGPIIYQEEYEIKDEDHSEKLLLELFKKSAEFLPEIVNKFAAEELNEETQDDSLATFTDILKKEDGYIDVKKPPSPQKLDRIIRAFTPWPGAWTKYKLNGKELIIKFHPGGIIHVEGKKPMTYKDFINGYQEGKKLLKKLNLYSEG